ncbi:MAG: LysR family transcriptional regulator [Desulfovibrionaceae bacterium]|nr:LysR family transcriptional regulator [Desulfovibrionaceae bacterium]
MEFRHLRYFLALADELHFGRAAQRLAISQPPLSWNIQQLEQSMGARLFVRNSKSVRLTEAGRAFAPAARALLTQADEAARLARDVQRGVSGMVRVGFVSSMLYRGLPRLLRAHQQNHPGIRIRSFEMNSQSQIVALSHDQIDVGFVHTTQAPSELSRAMFSSEPFVCCLPADHPRTRARRIAPADLQAEVFVMFSREASPDYHERVLSICAAAGFLPDIRHEVRHWLSVVSQVAHGFGVALVPKAVRRAAVAGAVFVPLKEVAVQSQVYCVWRQSDDNAALLALREDISAQAISAGGPGW